MCINLNEACITLATKLIRKVLIRLYLLRKVDVSKRYKCTHAMQCTNFGFNE